MFNPTIYRTRRARVARRLENGIVVLGGHRRQPLNLPMNLSPARQSSHILYLTGLEETDSAMLLRLDNGRLELFGPAEDPEDEIWHGPRPTFQETAERLGADAAYPLSELETRIEHHRDAGPLHTLPSADPGWPARMASVGVTIHSFGEMPRNQPSPLADAMIALRSIHGQEEIDEMRTAAAVTARAFRAAMAATRSGGHEAQLRALIEGIYRSAGMRPSFDPIVTIRGEVLHCEANPNRLEAGDLLLVDTGAESLEGYAADVTRTWPVRGRFDMHQRAIYEIVLEAEIQCIDRVRAGTEYLDIHIHAARIIAQGLKDMGILRGMVDDIVDNDAHALFFPHGVGHFVGLDVHDIEDLGDRAGYAPGRRRSSRFGLAALRLNRKLEPGMAVTIEPGVYFIPGLIRNATFRERYREWVDFDRAETWIGFGGIRIEDDVLVTAGEPDVLTRAIPKRVEDIEDIIGEAPEALGALADARP